MTVRKNSRTASGSLESVLEALPERFREAKVYADNGTMTGLQRYVADLTEHIRQETGRETPTLWRWR